MATRTIIEIDADRCNGCGDCIPNCVEGALKIVDGVATLVSDVLCDGMGVCLGHCPEDAISLIEREAEEFDEAAVAQYQRAIDAHRAAPTGRARPGFDRSDAGTAGVRAHGGGCPGSMAREFRPASIPATNVGSRGSGSVSSPVTNPGTSNGSPVPSQLASWPVQLHLLNPAAPFLKDADLLLCADCVPFALPDFHSRYLSGRRVAIGCPKLDDVSPYVEKLAMIFRNGIRSLTVVKMEVPCCGGLVQIAAQAMAIAGVRVPVTVETVSVRGEVLVG